jgi:hypothetical protein
MENTLKQDSEAYLLLNETNKTNQSFEKSAKKYNVFGIYSLSLVMGLGWCFFG